MKRNSTAVTGALHPILFFFFIYGVSLFLAFFVCRTVFFSLNGDKDVTQTSTINTKNINAASTSMRAAAF